MNRPLDSKTLNQLLSQREAPCLSLYQPTHRSFPERQQDPIRFRHLVRQLEESLKQQGWAEHAEALLRPFQELLNNAEFWNHNLDGLAVFGCAGYFQFFRLQRRVPEFAVANDRMHVKPLVRIAQSADRYQILCLSRDSVRLLGGNRDALDEITLHENVPRTLAEALGSELTEKSQSGFAQGFSRASERGDPMQNEAGGAGKQAEIERDRDRFFREVDRTILEYHSRPSGLPLILAALPEHQSHFRRISHNECLLPEGIEVGQGALTLNELREDSWLVMQPRYLKRLEGLLNQFGTSHGKGLASDQLEDIGQAATEGRVATLLVEAERQIPGYVDKAEGKATPAADDAATTPDLLDELTIWTLEQGGEVIVVPTERMPTQSGAAAIYRY
ncbi:MULTISPECIES: hypothetical protein [Pseudomonadaceae]|uniref:Uncharacterized protein n=1 Tax=Pseudomonas saudiphocaensis TaxID=1499686 RepID=A0A078LWC6_9PSED|nr:MULTISPECIES: hypothetical protein [Pseudomonadaceae]MBE7927031.1 hypothetical protein [Pseudomonas saudiphocaensis]MCF6782886.1 hypothetical protein [Stutzerimonas stutzeri]MCF6803997.1 hypothetical protein [Stutzerimonas stutzeri]CDZ94166.1 hypothetical protein BN1079_01478 [Pseudomonas saudiphocaensis]